LKLAFIPVLSKGANLRLKRSSFTLERTDSWYERIDFRSGKADFWPENPDGVTDGQMDGQSVEGRDK